MSDVTANIALLLCKAGCVYSVRRTCTLKGLQAGVTHAAVSAAGRSWRKSNDIRWEQGLTKRPTTTGLPLCSIFLLPGAQAGSSAAPEDVLQQTAAALVPCPGIQIRDLAAAHTTACFRKSGQEWAFLTPKEAE